MKNSEYIKITKVKASKNKLKVELTLSKNIKKYFFKNNFEVCYDKNIENIDESILSIPAVCPIVQIAWATGADLYVEKLDRTCFFFLRKIRKVFEDYYPKFSHSGDIHIKKIIPNEYSNKQSALLFSGGLDSQVSHIRNKDQNPILFSILKEEFSGKMVKKQNQVKNILKKFANQNGNEIHFIKSDLIEYRSNTINNRLLERNLEIKNWWADVSHGLILLSLVAPLTVEKIGKVIMASSYEKNYKISQGSHFLAKNDFSWADIKVIYDGSDLSKQEKIRVFKQNPSYHKYLQVCIRPNLRSDLMNCGFCEKCMRTITSLILEGIDPNTCNFETKDNVLNEVKDLFIPGKFYDHHYFWQDIQAHIPDSINEDDISKKYGAYQFFTWLRDFDVENIPEGIQFVNNLKLLYYCLKYHSIVFTSKVMRDYVLKKVRRTVN